MQKDNFLELKVFLIQFFMLVPLNPSKHDTNCKLSLFFIREFGEATDEFSNQEMFKNMFVGSDGILKIGAAMFARIGATITDHVITNVDTWLDEHKNRLSKTTAKLVNLYLF